MAATLGPCAFDVGKFRARPRHALPVGALYGDPSPLLAQVRVVWVRLTKAETPKMTRTKGVGIYYWAGENNMPTQGTLSP